MAEVADLVRSRADSSVAVRGVLGVEGRCGDEDGGCDCFCRSASMRGCKSLICIRMAVQVEELLQFV